MQQRGEKGLDNVIRTGGTWSQTGLPAGDYSKIVQEKVPTHVKMPSEDEKNHLLEIFRAVSGAEGKASWEVAPGGNHHGHFLGRFRLVVHLIESFLKIPNADEAVASTVRLQFVRIRDEKNPAKRSLIEFTIVDDHAARSLYRLMARDFLRREGGSPPQAVPFDELSSRDVFRDRLLNELSVWSVQAVRWDPNRGSSRE